MSKQFLTAHTVDNAHASHIFALAATPYGLLSASGSSDIVLHDCSQPTFPVKQIIPNAHRLGCHHLCASRDGRLAASVGFDGTIKLWFWSRAISEWVFGCKVRAESGEVWALALNETGDVLAATAQDGTINMWDVKDSLTPRFIGAYDTAGRTKGSLGLCIDISRDGKYTASGHENGAIYVFDNSNQKMIYALQGLYKPVRALSFSPGGSRLAAASDTGIIAIYDLHHGEVVGSLEGHRSWITSVDWSETGEWLLSGAYNGRVKVWSVERGQCVATHCEVPQPVWAARWLPKAPGMKGEMFAAAGMNRSVTFYREATGA